MAEWAVGGGRELGAGAAGDWFGATTLHWVFRRFVVVSLCVRFLFCEWKWHLCSSAGGRIDLGDVFTMLLNAKNTIFSSLFHYICRPKLVGETAKCWML